MVHMQHCINELEYIFLLAEIDAGEFLTVFVL